MPHHQPPLPHPHLAAGSATVSIALSTLLNYILHAWKMPFSYKKDIKIIFADQNALADVGGWWVPLMCAPVSFFSSLDSFWPKLYQVARMHSSRMRTGRALTNRNSWFWRGACMPHVCPRYACPRARIPRLGTHPQACMPPWGHTHPLWTESQTRVKT